MAVSTTPGVAAVFIEVFLSMAVSTSLFFVWQGLLDNYFHGQLILGLARITVSLLTTYFYLVIFFLKKFRTAETLIISL